MTVIVIAIIVPPRAPRPLLYVGFGDTPESTQAVEPKMLLPHIAEKGSRIWGGVQKNSLIIFFDVICDSRTNGDTTFPALFLADSETDFVDASYGKFEGGQWVDFFSYLDAVLQALAQASNSSDFKHVFFGLNIQSPDAPAGIPPQLNRFSKQVKEQWDSKMKAAENIGVTCWLSHDFGQRNYYHSDSKKVGTHFKRVFESFMLARDVQLSNLGEVTSSTMLDSTNGLVSAVTKSAASHECIQTPIPLTCYPDRQIDDQVRLYSAPENQELGSLFQYPARSKPDANLEKWWAELRDKIRHQHWAIENPFDLQRASMLLLQYEDNWYKGREKKFSAAVSQELNAILSAEQTILPPTHSVYDAQLTSPISNEDFSEVTSGFSLDWLKMPQVDEKGKSIDTPLSRWRSATGGRMHRAAFEIFNAFADAPAVDFRKTLEAISPEIEKFSSTSPPLNELVYLKRIKEEFPNERYGKDHEIAVLASLKTRRRANRFFSQLSPVLLDFFKEDFEKFENRRRNLEDRLFAFEAELDRPDSDLADKGLDKEFEKLEKKYEGIQIQHDELAKSIEDANWLLVEAPHVFRFAVEVISNSSSNNTLELDLINEYAKAWQGLADTIRISKDDADGIRNRIEKLKNAKMEMYQQGEDSLIGSAKVTRYTELSRLTTKDRNRNQRLLRYWPGKLSDATDSDHDSTPREYMRKILNASTVEQTGDIDVVKQSSQYLGLVNELSEKVHRLRFLRSDRNDQSSILAEFSGKTLLRKSAALTHMIWPNFESESKNTRSISKKVIQAINQLHFEKSDLQFDRIVRDFWGTKVGDKVFLQKALENHEQIVERSLRRPAIKVFAREQWLKASKEINSSAETEQTWSEVRKDVVAAGKEAFSDGANWRNNDSLPINSLFDELRNSEASKTRAFRRFVEEQFSDGNELLLSVRTPLEGIENQFTLTRAERMLDDNIAWRYEKFGDPLPREIYLRGWQVPKLLPDYVVKESPFNIPLAFVPVKPRAAKINFRYKDANDKKTKITFLIDCSKSMGDPDDPQVGSMPKLKRALIGTDKIGGGSVLAKLLSRPDIELDLFAFGATKEVKLDRDGKFVVDENDNVPYLPSKLQQSKYWKTIIEPIYFGGQRIEFPGDGSDEWDVLHYQGKANDFVDLKSAIDELQPAGETPLYAGTIHALNRSNFEDENPYFVVLTDGDDRLSPREEDGKVKTYDKWKLKRLIEEKGVKERIAAFNFESIENEFKKLAGVHQRGNDLEKFLEDLFPLPVVKGSYDGKTKLMDATELKSGRDNLAFNIGPQVFRNIEKKWSIEVESEGKIVLDRRAKWTSEVALAGNERIEFDYDPRQGVISLNGPPVSTGPKVVVQDQEIELRREQGYLEYLEEFNLPQDLSIDYWTTAKNSLTPSPSFAFITGSNVGGNQILFQDYNEVQSGVNESNKRRINFNPINVELFKKLGFQGKTSLDIRLQTSGRAEGFWHLLEFDAKNFTFRDKTNDIRTRLQNKSFMIETGSKEFQVSIKGDDSQGIGVITFSVSKNEPDDRIPLDCWLIQVLEHKTLRRNNDLFHEVSSDFEPIIRDYHFDTNGKLTKILHKFSFEHSNSENFNNGKTVLFGIHKLERNEPRFASVTTDELDE